MTQALDHPEPDQVEISIFGPGIGECIVVHGGDNEWMVVDSCIEGSSPCALQYLQRIGVPADRIRTVVVTHWHDDHIRGVSEVLEAATAASFHCSGALNTVEFKRLVKASRVAHIDAGTHEFERVAGILRSRSSGRRASVGPEWVTERQLIWQGPRIKVWALSPSSATITLAHNEIGQLLATAGPKRNVVSQRANALAVVLRVDIGSSSVLLSSDLECSQNPTTGWTAVVAAANAIGHHMGIATKVAHHGSEGADDVAAWKALLHGDVLAVTTPFQSSGLPRDSDRARLKSRTRNAYFTAPSTGRKPQHRDMRAVIDATALSRREVGTRMGHVRLRTAASVPSPDDVQVDMFGAAHR